MSWRGRWAAAQVTPVLASSVAWLLVSGAVPVIWLAVMVGVGMLLVTARGSRLALWIRFGVRPVTPLERDTVLAVLVPVASLRGRGQPRVWVGLRGVDVWAVGPRHLLVSRRLLVDLAAGRLHDEQVCAAACYRLGQAAPAASALVRAVELYCTPWRLLARLAGAASRMAPRLPLLGFAWTIRPVVFVLAAVNAYTTGPVFWREVVVAVVLVVSVLTYTTPVLRRRWQVRLEDLGDARVVADGFGAVWAGMLPSPVAGPRRLWRVERLSGTQPGGWSSPKPDGPAVPSTAVEEPRGPSDTWPDHITDHDGQEGVHP